jgi:flagellar hook-basal body complex protein FliE
MNEISFISSISPISGEIKSNDIHTEKKEVFLDVFENAIHSVNQYQKDADIAASELAAGNTKDIHNTMIAMEKSAISLQLLIEIRNNIIDAYKELSRMQV